ncbi:hypothetical protein [Streptomyces aidingensis]|uniref:META domain-containing protein n=1 Tax=Streptomyces aidingensis TaxID=910347 RepID=A0A1I1MDW1_9ACTN|nr:hypothetical protein [Streptomyces aidingensis]SFC83584.1 hypothetical protein SAMN05421773_106213 [Streptomyces aidingensis]
MYGTSRRKNGLLVAVAAALAVGLAGCGDTPAGGLPGDGGPGGGDSPVSDGDGAGTDPGSGPGTGPGPEVTEPPDPAAFRRRAEQVAAEWPDVAPLAEFDPDIWRVQGVREAGPSDTELAVQVGHGSCDHGWGAQVHETDALVIVGNWTFQRDAEVVACDDMLHVVEMTVELAAPLGERTVVDAATGMDVRSGEFTGGY